MAHRRVPAQQVPQQVPLWCPTEEEEPFRDLESCWMKTEQPPGRSGGGLTLSLTLRGVRDRKWTITESRTLCLTPPLRKWLFLTHTSGLGSVWSIFRKRSIWAGDPSPWVLSDKGHQTGSVLKIHFSWRGKTMVLASGWEPRPPK